MTIEQLIEHVLDFVGDEINNRKPQDYGAIGDILEDAKNLENSLHSSMLDEYNESIEQIRKESYDQGFDHGLNEGIEQNAEEVHSKIEDFTKFACEVVNYGNDTERHNFVDRVSECGGFEDLPTSRMDIM